MYSLATSDISRLSRLKIFVKKIPNWFGIFELVLLVLAVGTVQQQVSGRTHPIPQRYTLPKPSTRSAQSQRLSSHMSAVMGFTHSSTSSVKTRSEHLRTRQVSWLWCAHLFSFFVVGVCLFYDSTFSFKELLNHTHTF